MAFLDNSGDIILDAVLTDTGRLRLAQGDGSFKISKFAIGDDEINYALYNKSHASGSAYYDLEVLQTPVLEAFTNNTSNLKTKLISVSRTNILYMPVLKLNNNKDDNPKAQYGTSMFFQKTPPSVATNNTAIPLQDRFYIAVDEDTYAMASRVRIAAAPTVHVEPDAGNGFVTGLIKGYAGGTIVDNGHQIRVDQGLDTSTLPPELGLDSDLQESAYIVELDYRLGRVKPPSADLNGGDTPTAVNFIDDDNIASYYLTNGTYVDPKEHPGNSSVGTSKSAEDLKGDHNTQAFEGPRGSTVQFRIQASQELRSSTYLFTQIGLSQAAEGSSILGLPTNSGTTTDSFIVGKTLYYIDSTIRVIGANTGYRLDIPVRYIKIA
tara:strand:- start:429 stop:1565 length:1137 start_codon:yes stop_codon:yes gene_type:complete